MPRRTAAEEPASTPRHAARILAFTVSGLLLLSLVAGTLSQCSVSTDSAEASFALVITVTPGDEEARLRQRLAEHPQDVGAMLALADLLSNTGRGLEAVSLYEQAVHLRPDDPAIRLAFGRTLLLYGYYADAEVQLQRAHDLDPADPAPLYFLAQLYESRTPPEPERARALYQAVVQSAPDSPYARLASQRLEALQ